MATSQEAISRLSIQATLTGEAEVTAGLNRIAVAQASNDKTAVSLEKSFANLEKRYVAGVAAQQQYAKIQAQVNAAVQQNPALQERANAVLAAAAQRHDALTNSQRALGTVTSDLNSRVQASAGAFGVVGAALSVLGPIGIGVAAVFGTVYLAINHMISEANRMGEAAIEARKFADVTGLTIEQIKGLTKVSANMGVDSERVTGAVEKFTIGLEEARKGTGLLFEKVREINPELAMQLALSKSTAEGIDAYALALKNASSVSQRQALGRAGLGRGGSEVTLPLVAVADMGGLDVAAEKTKKVSGLTGDWVREVAHLREQNIQLEKAIANTMAAAYTKEVLERQNQFLKMELEITRATVDLTNARARAGQELGDEFSMQRDTAVTRAEVVDRPAANDNASQVVTTKELSKATQELKEREAARAKALAEQREAAIFASNLMKEQIGLLGTAATFEERRLSKLKELTAAMLESRFSAKDPDENQRLHNRAAEAVNLDTMIAKQSAYVGALGASAPIVEIVRDRELQLQKQRQQDPRITQDVIDFQKKLVASQQLGTFQLDAATAAEKVRIDALFMSKEAGISYEIVQTKINEAIAKGSPLNDKQIYDLRKSADEFAKVKVKGDLYTDMMRTAQQSGASFTNDLISGLGQGQTAVESLHNAFKNLSASLTSGALQALFRGDLFSAAVLGISAAVSAIFSANTSTSGEKWLKQQTEGRDSRLSDIAQRSAMIGVDTNTRAGAILAQDAEFHRQRIAENKAGGQAMNSLLQVQVQERNQLMSDWDKKETDLLQANADAKLAIEKAAADRALGFQNRLFAATNDFSTLEGQLAAFDRTAGQERLLEAANDNNKLVDLDAAAAAERFNVIKSYNEKIVADSEATAKAQRDALNGAAKSITEFVAGLYAGPNTTQSPLARRASAGTIYSSQLALAQNNDPTALGRITSDAQNLIDAERAISASSEAFQQLRDNVAAQLLSLPAVQQTTDPAVAAMRDVLTAINIGNQALNAANTLTTGSVLPAVNSGSAVNVALALKAYFNQIDPSGKLSDIAARALSSVGLENTYLPFLPDVYTHTSLTKAAVDTNNTLTGTNNSLTTTANGLVQASNSFLTAINTFADRIIQAINEQGYLHSAIGNQTNQQLAILLHWQPKLVYGGKGETAATGADAFTSIPYSAHALGGVIPAHGLGLVSEHLNPTFLRAGNEPITVSPFAPVPFNDNRPINVAAPVLRGGGGNADIVAELRANREELKSVKAELAKLQNIVSGSAARGAQATVETGKKIVEASDRQTKELASVERQKIRARG